MILNLIIIYIIKAKNHIISNKALYNDKVKEYSKILLIINETTRLNNNLINIEKILLNFNCFILLYNSNFL